MATRKLHIFTAIRAEAAAIRPVLPEGVGLTIIGIGAVRLPRQIEPEAIIMAGFAGALDPALRVGDIVHDDPPGNIFTSKDLVATAREKASLFARTSAKAVDMENAIVRAFADSIGVDFAGIRAISDTADQAVDPVLLQLVDEIGRPRPAAIARELLRRPSLIPMLNQLRLNSGMAGRALANALRIFLNENSEDSE